MANKYRGEVPIRLDRVRTLKFTFNSTVKFQAAAGRPIEAVMQELMLTARDLQGGKIRPPTVGNLEVGLMLWAALLHEDPILTPDQAGDMIEHAEGDGMNAKVKWIAAKVVAAYWLWAGNDDLKKTALKMLERLDRGELDLSEEPTDEGENSTTSGSLSGPGDGTGQGSSRLPTATSASVPTSSGA